MQQVYFIRALKFTSWCML